MIHLEIEEILELHDLVIERYGGLTGCLDPERISALVSRVHNLEFYGGETSVFALAAMYWVAIAKGHAFADGNKRTAVLAALVFLKRNGQSVYMRSDLEAVALKVACDEMSASDLAVYLRESFGN